MPIATGLVENIDGKFITVNGERYSAFAPTQIKCSPGENVSFEYVEKHSMNKFGNPVVYKNIKGNVYGKGGAPVAASGMAYRPPAGGGFITPATKVGEPILSKDRLILRQNALTAAVNRCNVTNPDADASFIISIAKQFEAYTSGDADLKEVEAALNSGEKEE